MFQNWGFWEVVKACVQVTELLRVLFVLGQSSFLLCAFWRIPSPWIRWAFWHF